MGEEADLLDGFLVVVNFDESRPKWADAEPLEDWVAGTILEIAPVTHEVERVFAEQTLCEHTFEEADVPLEAASIEPVRVLNVAIVELISRRDRRGAERDATDLERSAWGLSDETETQSLQKNITRLDEEIARFKTRIEDLLSMRDELRREAVRVDSSSKDIWLGKTLSVGSS